LSHLAFLPGCSGHLHQLADWGVPGENGTVLRLPPDVAQGSQRHEAGDWAGQRAAPFGHLTQTAQGRLVKRSR